MGRSEFGSFKALGLLFLLPFLLAEPFDLALRVGIEFTCPGGDRGFGIGKVRRKQRAALFH